MGSQAEWLLHRISSRSMTSLDLRRQKSYPRLPLSTMSAVSSVLCLPLRRVKGWDERRPFSLEV